MIHRVRHNQVRTLLINSQSLIRRWDTSVENMGYINLKKTPQMYLAETPEGTLL